MQSATGESESQSRPSQERTWEPRLGGYVAVAMLLWTGAVCFSCGWSVRRQAKQSLATARKHANTAIEKDLFYRRWVASNGGVYVRVDDRNRPNPYLKGPDRDIETENGTLTLVNPAFMGRQVYELEGQRSGVRSHITSLRPVRASNYADAWEQQALRAFENGAEEFSSQDVLDGRSYMRLMRPLYTEQACLRCHVEQGYQVGDVRGGISVAVPLEPLWALARYSNAVLAANHAFLWILGMCGIVLGAKMLRRQIRDRWRTERRLEQSEANRQVLHERNSRFRAEQELVATKARLDVAAKLQKKMLPREVPSVPGLEIAAVFRPADETGGDFYDFVWLPDGSLGIVIADVAGHGIDAALLMSLTLAHLRVLATVYNDVGEISSRLNELLLEEAESRFVTLFMARVDTAAGSLTYASTGHRSFLINGDGSLQTLGPNNVPLSVLADVPMSTSEPCKLESGQVLLLVTDGVLEAVNASGDQFGTRRVVDSIQQRRHLHPDEILEELLLDVDRFLDGRPQEDDMTAVLVMVS